MVPDDDWEDDALPLEPSEAEQRDEGAYDLHVRRLIGLVERGVLVGLGNLRRPRSSEVCLPG